MFNTLISWSLRNKTAVLLGAFAVSVLGVWSIATMKVDILPDINKPTVTIFAESPGLAAEEVERLILVPIEAAISGAPGVERIRSNASYAQATVNMEFAWGSDTLRNRQVVQERLAQAALPQGVRPVLGPSTSLLGEIMWVGMTSADAAASPMELRTLADWVVRPALLQIAGVADVLVMGGDVREWEIALSAEQMRRYGIMIDDVRDGIEKMLTNKSGGVIDDGVREYSIRIISAPESVEELYNIIVASPSMEGRTVRLGDIATLKESPSPIRGSGAIDGKPGVILRVIRQPDAQTVEVTDAIDEAFRTLGASLPEGVTLHPDLFRQESFIRAGLENVEGALRDGTILVVIVLIIFLMNVRTTMITLTAIPLSILVTAIVFKAAGLSVNVMTLGGIAVAVGELVDDAIVDVENIFRRLRIWIATGKKEDRETVVLHASQEVRNSIVYATILVVVVFLPILFMPGIEGKLLVALGSAYLVSLFASLLVSLTVTPVLSALFLSDTSLSGHEKETRVVQRIKERIEPLVRWCVTHMRFATGAVFALLVLGVGLYSFAGKAGIPPFNEGSMVAMVFLPPGTSLASMQAYMTRLEEALLRVEGVRQVSNIAGRAPSDPHGGATNSSEMQIALLPEYHHRREEVMKNIQAVFDVFGGADFSLGQPITHRVEMLLSGVRAPVVVKIFGTDQDDMDRVAALVLGELQKRDGISNARIQQNTIVPEFRIYVDKARLAEYGLSAGEVSDDLEMGIMGDTLGQVRLGPALVDVVARYDDESRDSTASLRDLALPFKAAGSLGSIADVRIEGGRNSIDHEGGRRTLVVSANYLGSDIVGDVEAVKQSIEEKKLPVGVTLSFEGNYKSQKESARLLSIMFLIGIVMIFGVLYHAFRSIPIVLLVMANIPTVLIGGMIGVWLTGGTVNLAHLVGFISLAGIVSRNGIMLIGRSLALVREEGAPFVEETIVRATLDRVVPVLMTSIVTVLALIPLMLAGGEPGKEMLSPLAVVVFGGLVSSTGISLFLTPALFFRFGKEAALRKDSVVSGF